MSAEVQRSRRRVFTGRHWRSRRSAAVAGVLFAVLLVTAILTMRAATEQTDALTLTADPQQRRLVATSLQIVPFAGIAFLWFLGVVRDQLGDVEDRLFSTVFLGSGLLFLATLFQGAATQTSVLTMLAGGTSRWVQLTFPLWVLVLSLTILVARPAGRAALAAGTTADEGAPAA